MQAGLKKIWRRVGGVDPDRPETAKAYLLLIGTRAMRDEVRRIVRNRDASAGDPDMMPAREPETLGFSGPVTALCLDR